MNPRPARLPLLLWLVPLSLGSGCVRSIGPPRIERDRFDYAGAIATSWKEQMLLNTVKLRYADPPVFLEVTSVISQYALEGQVSAGAAFPGLSGGDERSLGGAVRYADRPTITYSPLTGQKFTQSLLTPLRPASLFSMVQAGWRVDFVFRLCLKAINGVYNHSAAAMSAHEADPLFDSLLESLRRIQQERGLAMRVETRGNDEATLLVFPGEDTADTRNVREILGLSPDAREYRLVFGAVRVDPGEMAILSRSMIEILIELAAQVEVPERHVAERRVLPSPAREPELRVHSAVEKPADAFVSVRYRDHWFWIDDRDLPSKRLFSFLMILFSLAETGRPEGPLVTIPAG